jgi:DNA-directed RNA polymerase specialized sigma24 family protein
MTSWSSEDKEVLQEKYATASAKELSSELGRSAKAIHSKASRMDLQKEKSEERESTCSECEESYKHGGDKSWNNTTLCRACYDKRRRVDRKKRVVKELFDGECENCGYNGCLKALTLHHREPDDKEVRIT